MRKSSGERQVPSSSAVSDFDFIVGLYVGCLKAVALFIAKLGLRLNELLRSM